MTSEEKARLKQQRQMLKWLRGRRRQLKAFPKVFQVAVGLKKTNGVLTDEWCVRFHVFEKLSKDDLGSAGIPDFIDGIRTDVIVSNPRKDSRNGKRYGKLEGGIQVQNINNPESGTMGCMAYDEQGRVVGITNEHVVYYPGTAMNEKVVQPGNLDPPNTDVIGKLFRVFLPLDCAAFLVNTSRPIDPKFIVGFNAPITKPIKPIVGGRVKKSGVTTEITYGIIEDFINDHWMTIGPNPNRADPDEPISMSGDSGSIWVADIPEETRPVALHSQGNSSNIATAANIFSVLKKLNIQF